MHWGPNVTVICWLCIRKGASTKKEFEWRQNIQRSYHGISIAKYGYISCEMAFVLLLFIIWFITWEIYMVLKLNFLPQRNQFPDPHWLYAHDYGRRVELIQLLKYCSRVSKSILRRKNTTLHFLHFEKYNRAFSTRFNLGLPRLSIQLQITYWNLKHEELWSKQNRLKR